VLRIRDTILIYTSRLPSFLEFISAFAALVITVLIFLLVVWAQSLKVEIPLSFGRIRGHGIKWPLAFFYASVIPVILAAALTANLRMIRRIAEVYGGRSGMLGSWRLTRTVFTHLIATGAVAIGDDMIGSIAGGGVLSKVSRRFGEGVINGALTARVGIAAMEVCRPFPFHTTKKPTVTALGRRALTGLFGAS
jgi:hypothetical protein